MENPQCPVKMIVGHFAHGGMMTVRNQKLPSAAMAPSPTKSVP
jgi:hypothetical protein